MSSRTREGGSPRPARPTAQLVIRQPAVPGLGDRTRWSIVVSACVVSVLMNAGGLGVFTMLAIFAFPSVNAGEASGEVTVIETQVEDISKPPDLENDVQGLDPALPAGFDGPRIEQVNVPGPQNKEEVLGIRDAQAGPLMAAPPTAGLGDNSGTGGSMNALLKGHGNRIGDPGGFSSSQMKPGGYGARLVSGATRERTIGQAGGNTQSEAAVVAGLLWLARHQAADGHWSLDGFRRDGHCNCTGPGQNEDIAGTAFGLLPFLGAGHTHKPGTQDTGKFRKNVERGLKYLLLKQNSDGDFGSGQWEMYAHGLAAIAVCEAYGLTSDPMLKGPAQRALNFIARSQSPQGGWSYNAPCVGHDTSVGGWQLMALKSGQMAGLEVSPKTMAAAKRWLDDVADPDGSGYGYQGRPGDQYMPAMSAVGLLCREYTGWGPHSPALQKGVSRLLQIPAGQFNSMYYYYYATQVLHHFGGKAWERWNPRMRDQLIRTQDKGLDRGHPHQRGSWSPAGDVHGDVGGRLMVTSMSILTLEVYYRYLPLYRRDMGDNKQ